VSEAMALAPSTLTLLLDRLRSVSFGREARARAPSSPIRAFHRLRAVRP